ncbi:MAG: penicillin-binding transpeptidase domain-containing protein [Dehalococcoidia bacterium]|nr:penicillin-binding transpeptidase domain-containing protein [Dehalococcoidia bacterium]
MASSKNITTNKLRTYLASMIVSLIFLFILIYSSYFSSYDLSNSQLQNFTNTQRVGIEGMRGNIFDAKGNQLTKNVPRLQLAIIPKQLTDIKISTQILRKIEEATSIPFANLEDNLMLGLESNDPYRPVVIIDDISLNEAIKYSSIFASTDSTVILKNVMREYNNSNLFSRIIGSVGSIEEKNIKYYLDNGYMLNEKVGKSGLELQYESYLRGIDGKEVLTQLENNSSNELQFIQAPTRGQNLYLSIDYKLQQKSYEALIKHANLGINSFEDNKDMTIEGTIITIDVHTGQILSYISVPDFPGNTFAKLPSNKKVNQLLNDPKRPLLDRNIMENYPPGSIFKPIVGIGALEENIANENTVITTEGSITIKNEFNPEIEYVFEDWANHGVLDFKQGLARSSDVYYYYISGGYQDEQEIFKGLGSDKIAEYAKKFGLGTQTGIDLPGEISGLVPDRDWKSKTIKEPWVIGDTYQFGIGQSYLRVSPMQMAVVAATIANNGYLVTPKIVNNIGNVPNISENIMKKNKIDISKKSLTVMQESMKLAADPYGTAFTGEPEGIEIGGKTGTAEYGYSNEKKEYKTHAWYMGYAPYENPEIAIITFLKNGVGSTHAAPIAKEVLEYYFSNKKNEY